MFLAVAFSEIFVKILTIIEYHLGIKVFFVLSLCISAYELEIHIVYITQLMTAIAYKIANYIIGIVFFAMPVSVMAQSIGIDGEKNASIGIYIKDLRTNQTIVAKDIERGYVPASVTKIITSASAMTLLSEDYRFETIARLRGTQSASTSVWDGDIEIIASGDPTLDSDKISGNDEFVDSIVSSLKSMGISRVTGSIRLIDDDAPQQGPIEKWEIGDVAYAYGAGWYMFNWKDNIYRLNTTTNETKPYIPDLIVEKHRNRNGTSIVRGIGSSILSVYTPSTKKNNYVFSSMPCPWVAFEYALRKSLADAGIDVGHKYVCGDDDDTDDVKTIYSRFSPSRDIVLGSMMRRSDNMYAEGILRSFAPDEDRSEALSKEMDLWKHRGIDMQYTRVWDGSGLSRANRMSPLTLGCILEYMAQHEDSTDYIKLFPVSGVSGTMRSFMDETPYKGRLAFKTGSVNGVQCYAGYVINDVKSCHPTHVVVIMVNNFYCARKQLKIALQKYLVKQLKEIIK